MRKWFIFLIVLTACHKSANIPANNITGEWELSKVIGGFAGVQNYPAGNGNTIEFSSTGNFEQAVAGTTGKITGTYQVIETGLSDGQNILLRKYDGSSETIKDSVLISNGQLFISSPPACCDIPYNNIYRRKF